MRHVLIAALASCASTAQPTLDSVTPATAAQGGSAVITGANLCGTDGDCASAGGELDLGLDAPVRATITAYDATSISFSVAPITPVGPTALVLTVNDTSSNALAFEVTAP